MRILRLKALRYDLLMMLRRAVAKGIATGRGAQGAEKSPCRDRRILRLTTLRYDLLDESARARDPRNCHWGNSDHLPKPCGTTFSPNVSGANKRGALNNQGRDSVYDAANKNMARRWSKIALRKPARRDDDAQIRARGCGGEGGL
jgi:hypothetical protein